MAYTIQKYYNVTGGLDLRSSDLNRQPNFATDLLNATYRQTGALSKRKGQQKLAKKGVGGLGLYTFNNSNVETGVITQEMLSIDDNLHKMVEQSLNIQYTGPTNAYFDLYLDSGTSTFIFDLYENNTIIKTVDLGTGYSLVDVTVSQLNTSINTEANFTSTISDSGAAPAAFIPVSRIISLDATGVDTPYFSWEQVTSVTTNPFSDYKAAINNEEFELCTAAQINDVMYFCNGQTEMLKYDGNRIYRSGLLDAEDNPTSAGGGGSLTAASTYQWKYAYEYTDAKENIKISYAGDPVSYTTAGAGESRIITYNNIVTADGFNSSQGIVNGNQTTVNTINMTSHSFITGDFIYIEDGVTSSIVRKQITGTTTNTITFGGNAVTVNNADIISCIKVVLIRTKADGTLFYILNEFTNDETNGTAAFDDGIIDSGITVEFIESVKNSVLPSKCKYIDVWRGQVIVSGIDGNINKVSYSDINDAESFPVDQSFLVTSRLGGGNTGIRSLDSVLYIFKEKSISTVTGDLGLDQFRVDTLSEEGIGCTSHNSIQEVNKELWFLGLHGIYSTNSQQVIQQSRRISPLLTRDATYTARRVVGYHWLDTELYMLHLPELLTDGSGGFYADPASSVLVYDIFREAWLKWDNINMMGGITSYNDRVYLSGYYADSATNVATSFLSRILNTGLSDDFVDHEQPISFIFKSIWDALGEPSIFKKFLRIKILSLDSTVNDFETESFQINVQTEHDYETNIEADITLDFSGGSLGWGSSAWSTFPWGDVRVTQLVKKLSSKKTKSLRVSFLNDESKQNILISGFEIEIAAPFDMQIKE